ncbi:MAG: glycosyl hydrolase family 28 protein [Phycisphaerales bacterium]|nr:glycosyl hydrolase family 28 protein [Phycisphaerales bacterium]
MLRFSSDPNDYLPAVFVRWSGQECFNFSPLIYANGCRNIAITGSGRLLGGGRDWWEWHRHESRVSAQLYQMVLEDVPVSRRRFASRDQPLRPQMILPINCEDVLLSDFAIDEAGPFWSVHLAYCANVTVRGISINTPAGPNTNGIVVDSSRDVLIEHCRLDTNDDCVALKSGLNEDGWRVGRAAENIVIRHVECSGPSGAISIGSEMSGDVRNVLVHDCRIRRAGMGIRLKSARGRGGTVEDIVVRDVQMDRIDGDAVQITTEFSTFVSPDGRPPTFRHITIRNILCAEAETAVRLVGLPDCALQSICLQNLSIHSREGLLCTSATGILLEDLKIRPRTGPVFSIKDSQEVVINGLNPGANGNVFLDLRGRRTRNIRLAGESSYPGRPVVVLGADVPRDSILQE